MRAEPLLELAHFPSGASNPCAAAMADEGRLFLVGHEDGQLVMWSNEMDKGRLIGKFGSEIMSIAVSPYREIAVGCRSGLLVVIKLQNLKDQRVLQEATSSVLSRVWRVAWLNESSLISTSTYGSMTLWKKARGRWISSKIEGHSHSIFGLSVSRNMFASGDYSGSVQVFRFEAGTTDLIDQIASNRVQNLALGEDGSFATISRYGSLRFFEFDTSKKTWNPPIAISTATSRGNCLHITRDGESVFAGTDSELIQFDVQSQLVQHIRMKSVIAVFSTVDSVFVVNATGIGKFERTPAEVPLPLVRYKYVKVSLVGHTNVGKTSFARYLLGDEVQGIKSTIGREVKFWVPDPSIVPHQKIALYDHGGQETVLGTFLPLLTDSDVILVFFSQRDVHSWERAEQIIAELEETVPKDCKILLVRTHIDEADEVRDVKVNRLLEHIADIQGPYRVNNISGEGIDELKSALFQAISWDNARTVVESETNVIVESVIEEYRKAGANLVSFNKIREQVEQRLGNRISFGHLRYLLTNLTIEGIIEFYPQVLESVIFNDKKYNDLKSLIPFFVAERDGIVRFEELLDKFSPKDYVEVLDRVYVQYGVSIRNDGTRIFPGVLSDNGLDLPQDYLSLLKTPQKKGILKTPLKRIETGPIIEILSSLRLQCIGATLKTGLFAWEKNAFIYYSIQGTDDPLKGKYLIFEYVIGGIREEFCARLEREFSAIINQLYGEYNPDEPD